MIQISGNITADGVDADQREKLLEDNRSKDVQELRVTNSVFSFYINILSFLIFSFLYRLVKAFF